MDKNAIKKYAVWARTELIERVTQKAQQYEISADADPQADAVYGKLLSKDEKDQRTKLISKVKEKGYEQVMEEVAYTWFNRFSALRFMEVNNYLPSRVRVFTDANGDFKPQILTEAIHMELKGLNMEKVYALKEANDDEELFKYLIITQCNALAAILPGMFQKISDYTELMFPDNLLREDSVIEKMVVQGESDSIPECDWKDQIQIIGWLYQYYNTEPKDKVFADLKKNIKITKETIPAATQLFTPDWIVRYMVENSLGRLWLEGHPQNEKELLPTEEEQDAYIAGDRNSEDSKWHYYLKEAEQEPEVQAQLAEIRKEYAALKPEDILCIDPCMGSGHIIVYMFDALMRIYAAYGYSTRESVQSIIENNLYGLDIDDRAAQLAYFAVMMKAVQYDNRFLKRSEIPQPHVYAIKESNHLDSHAVDYFCNGDKKLISAMHTLIDELTDASEYGSILNITQVDFSALYARFKEIENDISMYREVALNELLPFVRAAETMAQKYGVVVTNPPYMGSNSFNEKMSEYAKKNYNDVKSDLFAMFIIKCKQMAKVNGYYSMITMHSWMFLSSYELLREQVNFSTLVSMVHLGTRAFDEISGEMVSTTAFSCRNVVMRDYTGTYQRLVDFAGEQSKERAYLEKNNICIAKQNNFAKIPGSPVAYWVSEAVANAFKNGESITKYVDTFQGIITGDNTKFLRLWCEVKADKIPFHAKSMSDVNLQEQYWIPYNKGGEFRKWYGVQDYVVYWKNGSSDKTRGKQGFSEYYLREYVSWSYTISNTIGTRYYPNGFLWDVRGSGLMDKSNMLFYLEGLISSKVGITLFRVNNSTLSCQVENIILLPILVDNERKNSVEQTVQENNKISQKDWDSFETSWDFKRHPLVELKQGAGYGIDMSKWNYTVKSAYEAWEQECNDRFNTLKANEEELNRIFIDIYGLQEELIPEVEDKDVTVRLADKKRDIRSLISYAVGCMFGRYSLDVEGLAYAGGEWDESKYKTFPADKDNIIPICDDEYFDDDIVNRFMKFIEVVYGKDTLEENLKFISDALGGKGAPREAIRNYFLNDFFKDHCKTYQKRPIYWLFDSGKKNGFKCLIYMHRYQPDTIARIRTDYVHEQQARYRTAIEGLERQITDASTSERVKNNKQLIKLKDQAEETRIFEEKIHHLADQMIKIDLDDGVTHNYAIFQDVLAKIK